MHRKILTIVISTLLLASLAHAEWKPRADRFEGMDSASIRKLFGTGPFVIIQRRTKTALPEITAGIIIEAEPAKVWKIVTDYQRRPEFIQGVSRVEDLRWEENKATFTQRNFIKFSFIKFGWDEHRVHVHYPNKRIEFYEADNPGEIVGGYELAPIEGGKATILLYSLIGDLTKMSFPVGNLAREVPMVEEILMTSAATMVLTGTKEYIESKQ